VQIVGIDMLSLQTSEQVQSYLTDHIRRLNRNEKYAGSIKVFIPENNLGLEHSHMERFVRHIPHLVTMREGKNGKPGVPKTKSITETLKNATESFLRNEQVRFASDCFTHTPGFDVDKMRGELIEQVNRMHYDDNNKLTGKMGGGLQDDLAIAFMMQAYWPDVFRRLERYANYC
jgi:hypothetical protein